MKIPRLTKEMYQWQVKREAQHLLGTIYKKVIVTMPLDKLLDDFDTSFEEDFEYRILKVERIVQLCSEDVNNTEIVRRFIDLLLQENIPSKKSQALDSTLLRLIRILPENEQRQFGLQFIQHTRKYRRTIGAKLLTHIVKQEDIEMIITYFRKYNDGNILLPLAFSNVTLSEIARIILKDIGNLFLQGRVLEKLLLENEQLAIELGRDFPAAFSYGIGRNGNPLYQGILLDIIYEYNFEPDTIPARLRDAQFHESHNLYFEEVSEILRLAIWALGKIGASEALISLSNHYSQMIHQIPTSQYTE